MKKLICMMGVLSALAWLSGPAWAGKPKWSADLADIYNGDDPDGGGPLAPSVFDNCDSKGSFKLVGSKYNMKASKTTSTVESDATPCNGDEYICIFSAYAHSGIMYYNTQTHFRAKAHNGSISFKADTCPTGSEPSCSPTVIPVVEQSLVCYNPDPAYTPTADIQLVGGGTCEGVYVYTMPLPTPPTSGKAFQSGTVTGNGYCVP